MNYVIVDLEATCWEITGSIERMEIIEIGAVKLAAQTLEIQAEFNSFVRPVHQPVLSRFCTALTSIRQEDVDGADEFPAVFGQFLDWIGPQPFTLCSWGKYDLRQFGVDCRRHRVSLPNSFRHHINLKKLFADRHGLKPCGMLRALSHFGMRAEGMNHRGIDDALNITRIAVELFRRN